ncbi:hypothetical protein [Streptomyces sp. NRRL F-5650]|uniref:hypothetical protein n=1 Tax=Streptomyces sp. NRRL F-5650 TaxID=1463868 RepID=UPI000AB19498|nr:hypothetical protein [Streptomyces sp. NRRL F-5650]
MRIWTRHEDTTAPYATEIADVEDHVLPLLREKGIRYTQVARAGRPDSAGVEVLSDTTNPGKVFSRGPWTLMDEMEENGTVPQYAGGHACSQKHKAFSIERLQLQRSGGQTVGKLFGYNADEYKRAAKANKFQAQRNRKAGYETFALDYPLLRLGWGREDVQGYVKDRLGLTWPNHIARYARFPESVRLSRTT